MPLLRSTYTGPPAYQCNGHLQTIVPSLMRRVPGVNYERKRLTFTDGDFVDLDWLDQRSNKLVVLTQELEGDSSRQHMLGMARLFGQHKYDFYQQASAINFMPGIVVPTLLLNAQNDPLLFPECFPVWLAELHPNIFLETPRSSGHDGVAIARGPHTYTERCALAFAPKP